MKQVRDAVILMAGLGSRLRETTKEIPKPLIQIAGRSVFAYTIDALKTSGIENLHVVIGFNGEALLAGLKPLVPRALQLHAIHNPDWKKQNGISVLAAKPHLRSPFLLTMGDHLFDPTIVDLLIGAADLSVLNVAIDRKVTSIFDLSDAMKIKTKGDRVVEIGKELDNYDAIDTGLFICPTQFFDYLERTERDNDCSLADGVRAMAIDGKVRAIDIGAAWWQDIDTPEMLAAAEKVLGGSDRRSTRRCAAP